MVNFSLVQGKAIDDLRSDVEKMKEKQESGSLNTSTSFPAKTTLPSEILVSHDSGAVYNYYNCHQLN